MVASAPRNPSVWVEIDLTAIGHNLSELRRVTEPGARFMAVVKANAYGHGVLPVARRALESGAQALGVARLDEAVSIRDAGFDVPLLIFGHTPPEAAARLLEYRLTPTIFELSTAAALSAAAAGTGRTLPVHLKVDTGMGRLGILPDGLRPRSASGSEAASAVEEVKAMARLPGIVLEGIYTHFAAADSTDKASARKQFKLFMEFVESLRTEGIDFALRHAANSAAIIDLPETHLDMVRAGIALYGLRPSDEVDLSRVSLKPAMTLKARIVHTKRVPAGFTVSYGSTFKTKSASVIATVPIGYADGYRRRLSNRGQMSIRGSRAPIAGRVCMDQTMLDVSHIPEVRVGDEVVIFGPPGEGVVTADDLATELKTINYEIVSAIMARVPRIYRDSGAP